MYKYNEDIRIGEKIRAREVAIEHKKTTMDPSRIVVQWEHALNLKKRMDLAAKTRMINRGKDMLKIQNLLQLQNN